MHIYLDESGNSAPLSRPAATRHFALAAIGIPDREEVEVAIQALRQQLGFDEEFKGQSASAQQREPQADREGAGPQLAAG